MEYLQVIAENVKCLEELYIQPFSGKDFSQVQLVLDIFPNVRHFMVTLPLILFSVKSFAF